MGGGKLPPRQKMIGMMYLVLTALLAMNVSKDVLNAFVVVNNSLLTTNRVIDDKNGVTMSDFAAAETKDPAKVKPFHDKAKEAHKYAKEMVDYIEALKLELVMKTDKKEEDKAAADTLKEKMQYIGSKDNYDTPTLIMIGSEPASPITGKFSAVELKQKIEQTRDKLVKLFDDPNVKFNKQISDVAVNSIKKGLTYPEKVRISEEGEEPWVLANFYHLPLAAVITNLSKIETDVKNAEADALKGLLASVKGADFTFDRLEAKVIAKSSYVIIGDSYEADVLLVASNSTSSPEIYAQSGHVDTTGKGNYDGLKNKLDVVGGVGKYKVPASGEGEQKWGGVIKVEKPGGGGFEYYPFNSTYISAKPAAAVSPEKMNVFYIGVPNPVAITAAGFDAGQVDAQISVGSITKSGAGKYTVNVPQSAQGKKATITVSAKGSDGKSKSIGSFEFRVKRIPDPIAKFGGKKGTADISKNDLGTAAGVIAEMENFDFDLKPQVVGFDITAMVGGFLKTESSNSNIVTPGQKNLLTQTKPGGRVFVEKVMVKMPDGTVRELGGVNLKVR